MSWVTRNLTQKITVWTITSRDGYGKPTYTRSTAKARWENKLTKTVDSTGSEIISNATVFLDTDVIVGSYLYEGVSTASSPPSDAREVKNFLKTPNVRGNIYERKALLK